MALIVVSNREPYSPARGKGGELQWKPSVGGLTAALEPIVTSRGGTWIAWGESQRDVTSVDLPAEKPSFRLERLRLSERDLRDFYYGFSNGALWPMSHYMLERAEYVREQWLAYERVNRRFADAVVKAYRPGDTIWVHDYQLALVPGLVRERLPEARIGFFWHIPWPSSEIFRTLPWDREILRGILGSDLIGVHTAEDARHFLSCCRIVLGTGPSSGAVPLDGRKARVEARPIGVEVDTLTELAQSREVRVAAARVRKQIATPILLGVDRLDYTKGIPERLRAFEAYLSANPEAIGKATLVQIAVPSREKVDAYRELREEVEFLVGRINGKHGRVGWSPVHYLYRGLSREELAAYYQAADVMLVTPLRDGLNLVAKEFAAVSRCGVLVLSEFAGAAAEMPEAVSVNPYDQHGMAERIREAMLMPARERLRRLAALRKRLRESDLQAWAEGFLASLERSA
jgi:trehalose 6-phosphate synthase/phosphatase